MSQNQLAIDQIYMTALEQQSPEARSTYLEEICGQDRNLRIRVERLLAAQDKAVEFLEQPVIDILAPDYRHGSEALGTTIGPYKLREQIGEGGFGIVYVAEQEQPIRRKVALKLIKRGMDSKEIIARFEAERQALAMMDHQHIAKVLDAGTTDDGRPYFVMELVNGLPITKFCNQQQLTTEERLKLFVDVCRAVQHAHQKGIIHRDLKPSNVLVTLHDGKPVVKVIDFGIAKALSQRLTENTVYTAMGQMVGTPMYMSPEQAEMSGLDVDTRSDIYSLGVLLYELLTGTTPFDRESLKNVGYAEVQRIIRETEPAKPSARLSTLKNEERSTITDERRVDLRKLEQTLRGDLDWVVMKALEKDRERRYGSAADFAEDIELYLNHLPVLAGPPSTIYRTRKYLRRHKLALTATALVLISMIAGTGFSVWQAKEAIDARKLADQRLALLKQEQTKLKAEQQKSEHHFGLAKHAVASLIDGVASNRLKSYPELADFRDSLLQTADQFYSDLMRESDNNAELLVARGNVRVQLNQLTEGIDDYLRALEIEPRNSDIHILLADCYRLPHHIGVLDKDRALYHARRAVDLSPRDPRSWTCLAWVFENSFDDGNEAAKAFRRAAALMSDPASQAFQLAQAFASEERREEALEAYTAAMEQYPEIVELSNGGILRARGVTYLRLHQYDEAIADFTNSLRVASFKSLLYEHRAYCYFQKQNYRRALDDWEQALKLSPQLKKKADSTTFFHWNHALECYLRLEEWNQAAALINERSGKDQSDFHLWNRQLSELIDSSHDEMLIAARDRFLEYIESQSRSADNRNELSTGDSTESPNNADPSQQKNSITPTNTSTNQ